MEKNIFENAYFGKAYKTRDGKKAIYHLKEKENNEHILIIDDWYAFIRYKSNGKYLGGNTNIDIVSEWDEQTDFKLVIVNIIRDILHFEQHNKFSEGITNTIRNKYERYI